jgi:hypothetical protein
MTNKPTPAMARAIGEVTLQCSERVGFAQQWAAGFAASCFTKQRGAAENKTLTDDQLQTYCSCTGNGALKRIPEYAADLTQIAASGTPTPAMQSVLDDMSRQCSQELAASLRSATPPQAANVAPASAAPAPHPAAAATATKSPPALASSWHPDPCSLLTAAQINAATGLSVGGGARSRDFCIWTDARTKYTVSLNFQKVEIYDHPLMRVQPVSGLGDNAHSSGPGDSVSLSVKKGGLAFWVTTNARLPAAKKLAVEKTLAQQALTKL